MSKMGAYGPSSTPGEKAQRWGELEVLAAGLAQAEVEILILVMVAHVRVLKSEEQSLGVGGMAMGLNLAVTF
jgi:hypothetical protein